MPKWTALVLADDIGGSDLGLRGTKIPTPNLNRLIADGVELSRHWGATTRSPTLISLLTRPCRNRFGVTFATGERSLSFSTVTSAGYPSNNSPADAA
jgi:arylsulfatase A-like enzyme